MPTPSLHRQPIDDADHLFRTTRPMTPPPAAAAEGRAACSFELHVCQWLPASAVATPETTPLLAARLRSRHPRINGRCRGPITLPSEACIVFEDVHLPADACFESTVGGAEFGPAHGVFIRQLYRGREVGRITWYFAAG